MTQYAYLIALLPLFAFLMIVFFLRWREKVASGFSIAMILVSWVMSIWFCSRLIAPRHGERYESLLLSDSFAKMNFEIGILVDATDRDHAGGGDDGRQLACRSIRSGT